jgi:hypothetical protein
VGSGERWPLMGRDAKECGISERTLLEIDGLGEWTYMVPTWRCMVDTMA